MKEPEKQKDWQSELEDLQARVDLLRRQLKKLQSGKIAVERTLKSSEKRKKEPGK